MPDADRLSTGWALAVFVACVAAVLVLGRRLGASKGSPPPPAATPPDADEPVCRARGCLAPATRGLPEARLWRPVPWLLPRWEVVTDPEADAAVCAAHHGPLVAALTARAALERAALEEHLAARHRELVAWALSQVPRDHGIAPPPPRPSPLRAPTVPPVNGAAVDAITSAETPEGPPS